MIHISPNQDEQIDGLLKLPALKIKNYKILLLLLNEMNVFIPDSIRPVRNYKAKEYFYGIIKFKEKIRIKIKFRL